MIKKLILAAVLIVDVFLFVKVVEEGRMQEDTTINTVKTVDYQWVDTSDSSVDTDITDDDRMALNSKYDYVKTSFYDLDVMQVIQRAKALEIDYSTNEHANLSWKNLYKKVQKSFPYSDDTSDEGQEFSGTTASELNLFLDKVKSGTVVVKSEHIELDETIVLPSGLHLKGSGTTLTSAADGLEMAISIADVKDVEVSGFVIDADCTYGIVARRTEKVYLSDNTIRHMGEKAIGFFERNNTLIIANNTIEDNHAGGIILNGDVSKGIIEGNTISGATGMVSFAAGIVLGSIDPKAAYDSNHSYVDTHLVDLKNAPHDIVIYRNVSKNNYAQGMYVHGGYKDYVVDNTLQDNDLEGISLGFGTVGCYLYRNTITGNGNRTQLSEDDDERFNKVPGISLDNAAYNLILQNSVRDNAGSGIKAVRCVLRCQIVANEVRDNNMGVSDWAHFYGIELASTPLPATPVIKGYDYAPCYENLLVSNQIIGAHYAGIFLGEDATNNVLRNNTIEGATQVDVEFVGEESDNIYLE